MRTQFEYLEFTFNNLRLHYRVFDKDGNGYISQDELRSAMEIMDESITEEQLNEIFKMADTDRDGKICYEGKFKGQMSLILGDGLISHLSLILLCRLYEDPHVIKWLFHWIFL